MSVNVHLWIKKSYTPSKKRSDITLVGTAIEELETESVFDNPMYKLQVDSDLKGKIQSKTVIINQNELSTV